MRGRGWLYILAVLILVFPSGSASAALQVIGTATYDDGGGAQEYNLILDDDNNGASVIWLDYTNGPGDWNTQINWAAGLNTTGVLTINWNPGIGVTWDNDGLGWRLPATVDGPYVYGCDGTTTGGYNITTSEMGHLYYTELGNLGYEDATPPCDDGPQAGYGLTNTGPFQNLDAVWYWSDEYAASPTTAWLFGFDGGFQGNDFKTRTTGYGLAVRSGQVSVEPESVPALSEWGYLSFILVLAACALWVTRRGL